MALLLAELSWPEVVEYLQRDDRLLLVTGSTEQHGLHMTFASDVWQPWELALRLSDRTQVLLAPPVNYGMSLHHMGFPGTLSLHPHTLTSVMVDLLESAYTHGFRHILILNGHGGNTAAIRVALSEALHELMGLEVRLENWWEAPEVRAVIDDSLPGQRSGHADASETSSILAIRPDVVHLDRAKHSPDSPKPSFLSRQVFLESFPHGVIGSDPRLASAELGERMLTAACDVYEKILASWGPVRPGQVQA
jgi:creatinine amidohydrolase